MKHSALLSLLLPCLPGPLTDSGIPSPWAAQRAGLEEVTGGEVEQPHCKTSLTAELHGEEESISQMCSPKMRTGGYLYRTNKNLWNLQEVNIPFKGSIVSHQVMHSA